MYTYRLETKEFISRRSLYWEPQENQQSLLVTETAYTADGAEEQVRQFSVSATATGVDKTDTQMAPYFNSDSVWDLDSEKWNNTVIPDSALRY